ncbi:MAG TPA: ATP-binding cassette domain-containing protein [Thermoanaerobaculia bacterium]|nr:ATP-binding cassette domain-containing protein [Thermoanaerobaculia bacterium]
MARGARDADPLEHLFSGVTISANGGRSLVLLGPNGCGKTSVARAILGLASLSSGRRTARPGIRFAYMPQDYRNAVFPWLSLKKNVALRLRQGAGDTTNEEDLIGHTAHEMVAMFRRLDLTVDLDRYPDEVSGGQLQLVLFVATLVMPGDVRVFDEPFSALDFRRRAIASEIISERIPMKPDEAWILITHDIAEGVQLADDVAVLGPTRSISAQINVPLSWPRGSEVRDAPASLAALRAVGEAAGIA